MKTICTGCGKDCSHAYGTWKGDPYHISCIPVPPSKKPRMRHCFNCGAELGQYAPDHYPLDTCGSRECEREARDIARQQRDEAHEQLDRDMGWR